MEEISNPNSVPDAEAPAGVSNQLSLLWGEAQLCLPYVCLKKEK